MPMYKKHKSLCKTESIMLYFTKADMNKLKHHPERKENEKFHIFIKRMIEKSIGSYLQ